MSLDLVASRIQAVSLRKKFRTVERKGGGENKRSSGLFINVYLLGKGVLERSFMDFSH